VKKKYIVAIIVTIVVAVSIVLLYSKSYLWKRNPSLKKVVVNEAARTLLYLPLYHAVEKGYFRETGLDVQIVTGGTATASFASMPVEKLNFLKQILCMCRSRGRKVDKQKWWRKPSVELLSGV
jgi:hypothetical protein